MKKFINQSLIEDRDHIRSSNQKPSNRKLPNINKHQISETVQLQKKINEMQRKINEYEAIQGPIKNSPQWNDSTIISNQQVINAYKPIQPKISARDKSFAKYSNGYLNVDENIM